MIVNNIFMSIFLIKKKNVFFYCFFLMFLENYIEYIVYKEVFVFFLFSGFLYSWLLAVN